MSKESPYIQSDQRLADVIAAIQVLATYKFYKLDIEKWAERISGEKANASHWGKVFKEHPEFFRISRSDDKDKASLVWRRSYPRLYHVDRHEELTKAVYDSLPEEERIGRVSRSPLTSSDLSTLINAATNLHSRALERKKDSRWWMHALVGVILGALLTYIGKIIDLVFM